MIIQMLMLGNNRWLSEDGSIHTGRVFSDDEIAARLRLDPDFDAATEGAPAPSDRLRDDNYEYWQQAAARGGHTLDDLLVS